MYKIIELEINPELSGDTGVFEVAWVEYPAIEQELMYFNEQKFYKAPEEVSKMACKAIEENEKRNNKAATQVGKIRAQQLCSKSEISLETIKRMKSYLERAATYNSGNWDDKGTISYNLWGGVPALEWVDSILKDIEEQEMEREPVNFEELTPREGNGELDILGYKTSNFKLCPGAQNLFLTLLENELDEDTKGMLRSAAILADLVFGIEYEVVDRGYAYSDELDKAKLVVEDFKDIINEVDNILKTTSNTDFMDGHIRLIEDYLTKKDEFVKPQIDENKKEFISRCIPVLISEGKTSEQAAGACYGMWDNREFFEVGVPHYTKDGVLYEGPTHKDADGRLMTGKEHTEDSEYLYHEGEFAEVGERGGIKESKKAPKSDTPNPNPKGEGTAKGKATDTRSAEVTQRVEEILQGKSDDFNERYKDKLGYGVNLGMLKSVYQRGVGAYNTSHSPNVKSAEQWALARVNAFLYLVKEGRPENSKYKNDNDLLPTKHPKREKFAPTKVSFDWDDTLTTKNGKKLLEQELSRGSIIYIISARNTPSQEMIDLANEYGFPATNIYTEGSNVEKIKKVKELGIKRHYDNNFNVVSELGPIGIKFDYETGGLPPYVSYPDDEEENDMLIEPELFDEDCGCMKAYPWDECISDQLERGYDQETAEKICGKIKALYNSKEDGLWDEYTMEDILMKIEFDDLAHRLSSQEFRAVTDPLLRGFTEQEIYDLEHANPVTYFRYDTKITAGPPDRDFCTSIEGRYFRRAQIDALRNTNLEFGHQGQPYSKWLYKGGPLCKHAFRKFLFQLNNKADLGWAEGGGGNAPRELVGKGFYPGTPKYEANLSKQSVGYIDDLECAFGDLCKIEFNKDTNQVFSAKEEERMIYTPLMIPNILIPRFDEVSQEKYFVKFTPETILNIRDKFMAELRNRKTNLEHSDKKFEDVVMVETWIVQGEKDKAYELGFTQEQVPFGTWMGAYKVLETKEGDFVWNNYIKSKKVRGASVEGNFLLNFSVEKRDEYLLEQIINILNKIID